MTALDPKANDFVAEKLGLWKREELCKNCYLISAPKHAELLAKFSMGHDIPAPDLLANPWRLVEALRKRGLNVEFRQKWAIIVHVQNEGMNSWQADIIDGDLARALLQAAHNMLKEEENHGR